MTVTGRQFEISSGEQWAVVTEVGANLRGYRVGDLDVTHVHDPNAIAPKSNGAVLMPWPNRIDAGRYSFGDQSYQLALSDPALGNASHGLSCWVRWEVIERQADQITLSCDVVPQKGWPFEAQSRVTYRVDEGGLTVTLAATNLGTTSMPFGAGSHPYLSIGDTPLDEVEIRLDATDRLTVDDRQIPTGRVAVADTEYDLRQGGPLGSLRIDTAYSGITMTDGRGAVHLRAGGRRTELWFDDSFTTVQLYTPPVLVDGPAVAVEPMSCPANAFNSGEGLKILQPGDSWSGQWGIYPDLTDF
jgi:aldose 1-epimerase